MSFLTSAVGKTKKKLGRAISKTMETGGDIVQAGENLVIGKPPGRTNSSSSFSSGGGGRRSPKGSRSPRAKSPKRTGSRAKSPTRTGSWGGKGRKSRGAEDEEVSDEVHMFCSSMYTHEFVLDAAKTVESNTHVSRLVLEDLIQRNETQTTEVIVDLLAENFYNSGGLAKKKGAGRGSHGSKRIWTSIVFVDCISDSDSYSNYLTLKQEFMTKMNQRLAMKGMAKELPIKIEAKIELHSLLDAYGVIQLLQAVERDLSVKAVKFPGFRGDDKEIAEAFTQLVDPQNMEWKETVVVMVKYRRSGPKPDDGSGNSATAVVGECAKAVQATIFSASMVGDGSSAFGFDPEELAAEEKPTALGKLEDHDSETEISLFDSDHTNSLRVVKPMSP